MKSGKRWIEAAYESAKACETAMPWERGARRAEMIARRIGDEEEQRTAMIA